MANLDEKSKRVFMMFTERRFSDPGFAFEFKDRLLNKGLPAIDAVRYAFILHDLDKHDRDNIESDGTIRWLKGTLKTPHFHVYAECEVTRRLSTIISKLGQALEFDTQLISIEKAVSAESCIQYLIHKNDPEKHQYTLSEVMTNIEPAELKVIMERDPEGFSVDFIVRAWNTSKDMTDFMKKIGLDRFKNYYRAIHALTNGFRRD